MMNFEDIKQDTPRFVVTFQRDGAGNELFQWGICGKIPLLSLVGQIIYVQSELFFKEFKGCPESALVLVWDEDTRSFEWFCSREIPINPLVGMLETIKATIVASHVARQFANQQMILGPDGTPIRH